MKNPDLLEYQSGKEDSVDEAEVILALTMMLIVAFTLYEAAVLVFC